MLVPKREKRLGSGICKNKDKDNYMNPDHTVKPLNHYGTGTVFFSLNTQEKNQLSKFDKVNFKLNSFSN